MRRSRLDGKMEGEPLQWPRLYVARSEDIECGHEVLLCAQRVGSRRLGLADILLVGPRRLDILDE